MEPAEKEEPVRDKHQLDLISKSGKPIMVFHAPYPLEAEPRAASRQRPIKMLEAFSELGYAAIEITGYPSDRRRGYKLLRDCVKRGIRVEFAYSENSTQPNLLATSLKKGFAPLLDARIFFYLRRHDIALGEFYRDIHWRFPKLNRHVSPLRRLGMQVLYRFDLLVLKLAGAHVFLPSREMKTLLPREWFATSELPPGGDIATTSRPEGLQLFYVGGVGPNYRLHELAKAVGRVKSTSLVLCVPEENWRNVSAEYEPYMSDAVRVVHRTADQLDDLYDEASLCVLSVEPTEYWKIAVPVKLFEYIGHGKPVLVTKRTHAAEIVRELGVGLEADYSAAALETVLLELVGRPHELSRLSEIAVKVRREHTWVARALEASQTLLSRSRGEA